MTEILNAIMAFVSLGALLIWAGWFLVTRIRPSSDAKHELAKAKRDFADRRAALHVLYVAELEANGFDGDSAELPAGTCRSQMALVQQIEIDLFHDADSWLFASASARLRNEAAKWRDLIGVAERIYDTAHISKWFDDHDDDWNKQTPLPKPGFDIDRWVAENAANPEQAAAMRAKLAKKFSQT